MRTGNIGWLWRDEEVKYICQYGCCYFAVIYAQAVSWQGISEEREDKMSLFFP